MAVWLAAIGKAWRYTKRASQASSCLTGCRKRRVWVSKMAAKQPLLSTQRRHFSFKVLWNTDQVILWPFMCQTGLRPVKLDKLCYRRSTWSVWEAVGSRRQSLKTRKTPRTDYLGFWRTTHIQPWMQDRRPLAVPSRVGHDWARLSAGWRTLLSLGFDAFVFDLKELKGGLGDNHTFIPHHLREATIINIIHVHLCNG